MKKILSILFLFATLFSFAQQARYNGWLPQGNAWGNNSAFLGTVDNNSIIFKTNNVKRFTIDSLGTFLTGALTYTDVNIWSKFQGSSNNYYQSIWQNSNSGSTASTDLVISNDLGTKTSYYANLGINSSGFSGSSIFSKPNTAYLTSQSSDLAIGTNTNRSIYLMANNTNTNVGFAKVDSLGNFSWYQNQTPGYYYSNITFRDLSTFGYSVACIYMGTPPSQQGALNYFAWSDSSIMRVNGQHTLQFCGNNMPFMTAVPERTTTGAQIAIETLNRDSVTANASINHLNIRANKIGWKTGTTASQNKVLIAADTYSAPVTATITNAIGLNVTRPTQGTNMVFTNPAWAAQFTGNFNVSGNSSYGSALLVPSALMHLAAPPASTCAIKFTTHTIPTLNAGEMDYNSATGFNWGSASVWAGAVTTPSVFGGSIASATLFLGSTSNATKGAINFGTGMTYDAVNKTLTIGSLVTGTKTLSVVGNADISSTLTSNGHINTGTMTTGGFTATTGYFSGLLTPTVGIKGTSTNDAATAGNVGEVKTICNAIGSAISYTTNTAMQTASLSLTAGDWLVSGNVNFSESASSVTVRKAAINVASNSLPSDGSEIYLDIVTTALSTNNSISLPPKRVSIAGTTTYYCTSICTFAAGTVSGYGCMTAVRIR